MKGKLFYFGWVATNVNSNFHLWSSWCDEGTIDQAQEFYQNTVEETEGKSLDWLCYPSPDPQGIYNLEIIKCF